MIITGSRGGRWRSLNVPGAQAETETPQTDVQAKPILFPPGQIVATPGALDMGIDLLPYLMRHLTGDWGDLEEHDWQENEFSLHRDLRLWSGYNTPNGRLIIITEADRSATTFLLPDEY